MKIKRHIQRGRSLEETTATLATMDYLGKDAAYSMNDVHRENVAFTYRALAEWGPGGSSDALREEES